MTTNMKTIALFLSIALLTATRSFSQEDRYDVVEYTDLFLNKVPMFSTKAFVIKKFGKPGKIKRVNGIEDLYWFDYYYNRSTIQINPEGYFMGFNIVDPSFLLTVKSTKIKIGDPVSLIKKIFPKSYKQYITTKSRFFRVRISDVDTYVLFTIVNGILTQVQIWDDNT